MAESSDAIKQMVKGGLVPSSSTVSPVRSYHHPCNYYCWCLQSCQHGSVSHRPARNVQIEATIPLSVCRQVQLGALCPLVLAINELQERCGCCITFLTFLLTSSTKRVLIDEVEGVHVAAEQFLRGGQGGGGGRRRERGDQRPDRPRQHSFHQRGSGRRGRLGSRAEKVRTKGVTVTHAHSQALRRAYLLSLLARLVPLSWEPSEGVGLHARQRIQRKTPVKSSCSTKAFSILCANASSHCV